MPGIVIRELKQNVAISNRQREKKCAEDFPNINGSFIHFANIYIGKADANETEIRKRWIK